MMTTSMDALASRCLRGDGACSTDHCGAGHIIESACIAAGTTRRAESLSAVIHSGDADAVWPATLSIPSASAICPACTRDRTIPTARVPTVDIVATRAWNCHRLRRYCTMIVRSPKCTVWSPTPGRHDQDRCQREREDSRPEYGCRRWPSVQTRRDAHAQVLKKAGATFRLMLCY